MTSREFINRHPGLAGAAIVAIVVLAVVVSLQSSRGPALSGAITQAYFSDDDGKTWFADEVNKQFPFDHNGHPAYRAYLFRCGSGVEFVGYLGSFAAANASKSSQGAPSRNAQFGEQHTPGMQVKKPGEAKWLPLNSPEGAAVSDVKCPDGGRPLAVLPR